MVESKYAYGIGRPDVIVKDKNRCRVMVIEAKHTKEEKQLPEKCREAVNQIQSKSTCRGWKRYKQKMQNYG